MKSYKAVECHLVKVARFPPLSDPRCVYLTSEKMYLVAIEDCPPDDKPWLISSRSRLAEDEVRELHTLFHVNSAKNFAQTTSRHGTMLSM